MIRVLLHRVFSTMILRTALLLLLGVSASNVTAQQSLLGGRFQTTTDVQAFLNLALDVRDMKAAVDPNEELHIYSNVRFEGMLLNTK
jgi:hypothetical protein